MAQKVILIDDLDGSEGSETLTYAVDGHEYEIDLSEKNAEKFRATLQDYIKASRTVDRAPQTPTSISRPARRRSTSTGNSGRDDIAAVRAWAQENEIEVAPRGRIKKEILEAYDDAHK